MLFRSPVRAVSFRFGYVRLCRVIFIFLILSLSLSLSLSDTHTHTHAHMHTCTHAHMHTCTQPVPIWAFYLITITLMGTNIYYSIIYTIICIGDQDLKHTGPYDEFYTQSLLIVYNKILVT